MRHDGGLHIQPPTLLPLLSLTHSDVHSVCKDFLEPWASIGSIRTLSRKTLKVKILQDLGVLGLGRGTPMPFVFYRKGRVAFLTNNISLYHIIVYDIHDFTLNFRPPPPILMYYYQPCYFWGKIVICVKYGLFGIPPLQSLLQLVNHPQLVTIWTFDLGGTTH